MKKILTIFAAVLIFQTIHAQIAPNPSIPDDPVDYTRLRLPTDDPAMPVIYTLVFNKEHDQERIMYLMTGSDGTSGAFAEDKVTLRGYLIHTWDFSPEYVENCIQHALQTSRIGTRENLAHLYKVTPKFKDFTYTNKQFAGDMFGFVTGVLTLSASVLAATEGVVVEGYDVIGTLAGMGTGAVGMTLSNASGGASTTDNVVGTAGVITTPIPHTAAGVANTALTTFQVGKVMWDTHERDVMRWANRVHLLNMARIDYFYNLVNMYLRSGITDENSIWVLASTRINKTMPFQFRRTMCSATWRVNLGAIKLLPLDNFGIYDYDGHYFGYLNADVFFDLSNYDTNFLKQLSYEQVVGLQGDQGDLMSNALSKAKDISHDIGGDMNLYRSMGYTISKVVNEKSRLRVSYRSPIHIKIEAPIDSHEPVLETNPDYFWDAYENKYTEQELRWSQIMRAMGIKVGDRDASCKSYVNIHKGYTATNKDTKDVIIAEEVVNSGGSHFRSANNGEISESKISLEETLQNHDILTTIPGGIIHVMLTSRADPPVQNAKAATAETWKKWFKKYNLSFNF